MSDKNYRDLPKIEDLKNMSVSELQELKSRIDSKLPEIQKSITDMSVQLKVIDNDLAKIKQEVPDIADLSEEQLVAKIEELQKEMDQLVC